MRCPKCDNPGMMRYNGGERGEGPNYWYCQECGYDEENAKKSVGKYTVWATQGQGSMLVECMDTLSDALLYVKLHEREASHGIKYPDGSWHNWDEKPAAIQAALPIDVTQTLIVGTQNWEGYWAKARYHYFRDSTDGLWGVAGLPIQIMATGMSQLHAMAFACLLNGDIEHAKELRDAAHTEPNQRKS
jgi:hypothetical protein